MKIKLYSDAHTKFVNKNYLNKKISNEEINRVKKIENIRFIEKPELKNYPGKIYDLNQKVRGVSEIVHDLSSYNDKVDILSLGCGYGDKEIWLARSNKNFNLDCIDNSPYVNSLNKVTNKFNLKNIKFKNADILRFNSRKKYDVIFCWAVIYCFEDHQLLEFYEKVKKLLKHNGIFYLGTTSVISPYFKMKTFIKNLLTIKPFQKNLIVTGWMRDEKEILRLLKNHFYLTDKTYFDHSGHYIFLRRFNYLLKMISCNIFSPTILFKLKK